MKYKIAILVAGAVVFIAVLFFIKTKTQYQQNKKEVVTGEAGLSYGNEIVGDLINKDTDGDGVLDWEESLWGTDPIKKDTNGDGVSDSVTIENLKKQSGQSEQASVSADQNLTQTDKFSREFFATVATLNQSGELDQATVDKLGSSLSEHIQNSQPKKTFALADIKVINDESTQAVKKYNNTLEDLQKKYPADNSVIDVLQKFVVDENNVDTSVLPELDPIIAQMNGIISGMLKTSVPKSLAPLHLDFINAMQRLSENLNDIKLYDTDVIVALGGISQYDSNSEAVQSAAQKLGDMIEQKLSN